MRILIFNPDEKGHSLVFLKLLIPPLASMGCEVALAITKQGAESDEFRLHLGPLAGRFEVDAAVRPAPGLSERRKRITEFVAAVNRSNANHVMLPYSDPLLPALGVYAALGRPLVPPEKTADYTLIRADFAYSTNAAKQRARSWVKERCIAGLPAGSVSLIDPVAYRRILQRGSCLAQRLCLLPEPLDNVVPIARAEARKRLGLPGDGRILGCTGRIGIRKGVDVLLRAFAQADLKSDDRLLLAGEVDSEITQLMERDLGGLARSGRIILLNRYLSDEELNWVICASDVVAATYLTSHSAPSGIVNKSAVIGRPVLASRFGWSDYMVPEFGLGTLTDATDLRILSGDIAVALDKSGSFLQSPKTARLREYLSPENFAASWTANVAGRLGHPVPELKTWDWVTG